MWPILSVLTRTEIARLSFPIWSTCVALASHVTRWSSWTKDPWIKNDFNLCPGFCFKTGCIRRMVCTLQWERCHEAFFIRAGVLLKTFILLKYTWFNVVFLEYRMLQLSVYTVVCPLLISHSLSSHPHPLILANYQPVLLVSLFLFHR